MPPTNPLLKTRDDYRDLIEHISLSDSPVGIDPKFTHAIIIDYLGQILARVEALEARLQALEATSP